MIKLTFYNNDVITSDTIDSTAALHDVEATLYASDLNDFFSMLRFGLVSESSDLIRLYLEQSHHVLHHFLL